MNPSTVSPVQRLSRRLGAWTGLVGLLPALLAAEPRDPFWVLLSDNAEIDLPRFETGATYACDPLPAAPAELSAVERAAPQAGGLGRLQDANRARNPAAAALGWNAGGASVTFDLKRDYRVEAVELLFPAGDKPEMLQVSCRPDDATTWRSVATAQPPQGGGPWQRLRLDGPATARYVRVTLHGGRDRLQVREARIWGRIPEPDPAVLPAAADDKDLLLTQDGSARAVIVVGDKPGLKTMAAARLLQDMISRMCGAVLPVVAHSGRTDLPRLLVGPSAAETAGTVVPQDYPENEHFVLRRHGRDVIIAGNDASPDPNGDPDLLTAAVTSAGMGPDSTGFHGTMTAVCAFLETQGARFYRWDDVRKYLITPRTPTMRVAALDLTERPAFIRRSISARPQTYTPARALWRIWNRIGGVQMAYTHNDIIPPAAYRTHPEYFSLLKGQRVDPAQSKVWQLCTSNAEVAHLASEAAATQLRASPGLRSYSLSPRDNVGFCECATCRARPGNLSDRWAAFANAVRRDFERHHPEFADRKLVFYAYWALSPPPREEKLARGVQVMFIGDGCHAHLWQSPFDDCPNRGMLEKLAGWKAASPTEPVLIYDWYIPATGTGENSQRWQHFPWLVSGKPFFDARTWRGTGSTVANVEIDGQFDKLALHWLPYFMVSRAMWDPSLSPDAMLRDLCGRLYGKAAGTMEELLKRTERSLAETDAHARTWRMPDPRAVYSPARRLEIAQLLRRAREETVDDALAHERVEDIGRAWEGGWKALEDMKPPSTKTELYNPNVGR